MEQNLLKLRKRKKIKVDNEDFIVEDFKDENKDNFQTKEIVLRNENPQNPKLIKQKVFVGKTENSKQAGVYRQMLLKKKFKNGVSFKSEKAFVGYKIAGEEKWQKKVLN